MVQVGVKEWKVLVTGGLGFVGRHMVRALSNAGHDVTTFDQAGPTWKVPERHITGDLLYGGALDEAVDGQDVIVHLAANASVRGGTDNPAWDFEQNMIGTSHLLEAMRAAGVPRILFASSSAVYGSTQMFPTPEDCPFPVQTSLYGASKVAAEALITAYVHGFGLQATICRFAPMVGEGYHRGHVYDFWRKLRADPKVIHVLGDGTQRRPYLYVKDAAAAVGLLLGRDNALEIFNVADHYAVQVNESLDWICDEMGVQPERTYGGESWAGDKQLTWLDCAKLRELGWQPTVGVEEAIRRTVRSFDD